MCREESSSAGGRPETEILYAQASANLLQPVSSTPVDQSFQ
jgi:hypothetical protein